MKKILIFLTLFSFLNSCSDNIFTDAASIDADEESYSIALDQLNAGDYDASILTLTTRVSAAGQTRVKMRDLLASAYAGKCGLNFVEYTTSLSAQASGSAMAIMMGPFVGRDADPASCRLALQTMDLIGPTAARTTNQNLFTSIVGMVLLGSTLRTAADINPALGDGTVDVNLCTGLTDSQVDNMIIGFGYFNQNFAAVDPSLIGGHSGGSMNGVTSACNSGLGAAVCQTTDPAQITPMMRDAFRDLTNTSDYGVGPVSTGGNPVLIPTACP